MFFIKRNIEKYAERIINNENFIFEELINILKSNIREKYKLKLLTITSEKISIKKVKYSETIKLYILSNNFDKDDLFILLDGYSDETNKMKKKIEELAAEHISSIIENNYDLPIQLYCKLILSDNVVRDTKIEILKKILPDLDQSSSYRFLSVLKLNDYLSIFDGKRPKIEKNSINQDILTILRKKGWISFSVDKKDENYYRIFSKKSARYKC